MKLPLSWLDIHPEVDSALQQRRPVAALESALIAHGLPWPHNLEAARLAEGAVRNEGVVPATIAVLKGRPTIGMSGPSLEELAKGEGISKLSRRDLAGAMAGGSTGATTVAATMYLAHCVGIKLFATGGIGGVHRPFCSQPGPGPLDVSADLIELSRTPVAVVCSGAKSILDIPRTLEALEMLGVPVIGFGTDEFPGFYLRSSGLTAPARLDTPAQAAELLAMHWQLDGAGAVIAQPVPGEAALPPQELEAALQIAETSARAQGIAGPKLTPFLLRQLAELTKGKTIQANLALVVNNARLAARIAKELAARVH